MAESANVRNLLLMKYPIEDKQEKLMLSVSVISSSIERFNVRISAYEMQFDSRPQEAASVFINMKHI